ncbi:MAG: hypothetical protein ACRD2C_28185 [Acidimicrobiales bacterium]
MTETDDVLDVLRRARPDELRDEQVSPHSTAAQGLLEDILSRPAATPKTRDDRTVVPAPRRGRHRRPALVAAAAAVMAVALVGSLLTVGSSEPSAAATLDAAVNRTSELIARSGRAEQRFRLDDRDEWTREFEFSGDDGSATFEPLGHIFRIVDGVGYTYEPVPPNYDHHEWRRLPGTYAFWRYPDGESGALGVDPLTLLETLSSAGDFEVVGDDTVDGVPTRRLRASDPDAALDLGQLRQGVEGTATSLEVWVDEHDIVRRIDLRIDDAFDLQGSTWSSSIRFFDLGEPIVIEAPGVVPVWEPPPDAEE